MLVQVFAILYFKIRIRLFLVCIETCTKAYIYIFEGRIKYDVAFAKTSLEVNDSYLTVSILLLLHLAWQTVLYGTVLLHSNI